MAGGAHESERAREAQLTRLRVKFDYLISSSLLIGTLSTRSERRQSARSLAHKRRFNFSEIFAKFCNSIFESSLGARASQPGASESFPFSTSALRAADEWRNAQPPSFTARVSDTSKRCRGGNTRPNEQKQRKISLRDQNV